jgi:hypothetical protein
MLGHRSNQSSAAGWSHQRVSAGSSSSSVRQGCRQSVSRAQRHNAAGQELAVFDRRRGASQFVCWAWRQQERGAVGAAAYENAGACGVRGTTRCEVSAEKRLLLVRKVFVSGSACCWAWRQQERGAVGAATYEDAGTGGVWGAPGRKVCFGQRLLYVSRAAGTHVWLAICVQDSSLIYASPQHLAVLSAFDWSDLFYAAILALCCLQSRT